MTDDPQWIAICEVDSTLRNAILQMSLCDDYDIFKLMIQELWLCDQSYAVRAGSVRIRTRVFGDRAHHKGPLYNHAGSASDGALVARDACWWTLPPLQDDEAMSVDLTISRLKGTGDWYCKTRRKFEPSAFHFTGRLPLDSLRLVAYAQDGTPLAMQFDSLTLYGLGNL